MRIVSYQPPCRLSPTVVNRAPLSNPPNGQNSTINTRISARTAELHLERAARRLRALLRRARLLHCTYLKKSRDAGSVAVLKAPPGIPGRCAGHAGMAGYIGGAIHTPAVEGLGGVGAA